MANVMEIVWFTLIPISSAAPLSSDTARMALPAFVLLINNVSRIMEMSMMAIVTRVIPEIVRPPIFTDGTLMTDWKGIGVALKIKSARFCKR